MHTGLKLHVFNGPLTSLSFYVVSIADKAENDSGKYKRREEM